MGGRDLLSLYPGAHTEHQKTSTTPINILKIEYPGPVFPKYYSDRPILISVPADDPIVCLPVVTDWGRFSSVQTAGQSLNSISDCSVTLADPDMVVRGYLQQITFQRIEATLYQWFWGTAHSDMVPLLKGSINYPVSWAEGDATVQFDLTDLSSFFDQTVGRIVTADEFPYISAEAENKIVPEVWGRVERSNTVQVVYGIETTLVHKLKGVPEATEMVVSDASRLPQGIPCKLWVGNELMKGFFDGNHFTIQKRGMMLYIGETTEKATEPLHVVSSSAPDPIAQFINNFINVEDAYGDLVTRLIIGVEDDAKTFIIDRPIWKGWEPYLVEGAKRYEIGTDIQEHKAGTKIRLHMGGRLPDGAQGEEFVWIANNMRSAAIERVEVRGVQRKEVVYNKTDAGGSGSEHLVDEREGWVVIPPTDYWINLDNSEIFPDSTVTTIHMRKNPKDLPNGIYLSNELRPTIQGAHNLGTGEVFTNSAYIIAQFLLIYAKGFGVGDLHLGSFTTAQTLCDELGLKFNFCLTQQKNVLQLVTEMAMQCRCSLDWPAGKAKLTFLYNRLNESDDPPEATIDEDKYEEGTIIEGQSELASIVTEIEASWIEEGERRRETIDDTSAEAQFGAHPRSFDCWAVNTRSQVVLVSQFWLHRWKHIWEQIRLNTFLRGLELLCGDPVKLEITNFHPDQMAKVVGIEHVPGNSEVGQMDNIEVLAQLPKYAGCLTSCEMYCETACESSCELVCQTGCEVTCESWACETACQDACQLICVTACELTCTTRCEYVCVTGCEVHCEQGGCETSCETSCETEACETGCESGDCETECETFCQTSACESACESWCESGCQSGCQVDCESDSCQVTCDGGCQGGCVSVCTVGCTAGCQGPCESICQTCCEYLATETTCSEGCETSCRSHCEYGYCESQCRDGTCITSCEVDCQTCCEHYLCETAGCQAGCEITCEGDCTSEGCQSVCTVESCIGGCQTSCTTSCMAECETECESDCETACEGYYESGCDTSCESTCETVCQITPCETVCETVCQCSCESQCETHCMTECETECETGCETSCTIYCETQCMTGCEIQPCETICQSGPCETGNCESECQTGCETADQGPCGYGCETQCETTCTVTCQSDCQTGCELAGCETVCQTGCESGCELYCELACQPWCEAGCQVGCETVCQIIGCETACEALCETNCESFCETDCETGCEDICQTGCELICQTGCEVTCETGCEVTCETGCEVTCETGCQVTCETGCQVTCETGCQVTCETGCEVTCETGCEVTCETGCEVTCETGCEATCETGCQVSCQLMCEVHCQVGCTAVGPCEIVCQTGPCELMCQVGCTSICETTCVSGCQTGCEIACQVAPPELCGSCEAGLEI